MKIEIETTEVLSTCEIKEIASKAVRDEVMRYIWGTEGRLTAEDNFQRIVNNHASKFLFDEVNAIVPNYKDKLVQIIGNLINSKNFTYDIFKQKDVWNKEEGFGWKIATEEMNKSEQLIRQKVRDAITNFNYSEIVLEKVASEVHDISYSLSNIADILTQMKTKNEND